jgi:class I fructose-bisphosphate aldolase
MKPADAVETILSNSRSENPGVVGRLARILLHRRLGGSGPLIILPGDQGVEHGPARRFAVDPEGYDPLHHHRLAIEAGPGAYAAPSR